MKITTGKQANAVKCLIYGPEGIGKTTFAAQFPAPVFIDTEGSTKYMDVARYDRPQTWEALLEEVRDAGNQTDFQTVVIDTADWAERLCIKAVCDRAKKSGIEDFGYGKGYTYVAEEYGKLVNLLDDIHKRGKHILLTAHAATRKFELPEEMGSYDRWELKMSKQVSPMLKEWVDFIFFANYKTIVITDDNKKKHAQGSSRVMYATHHACWDAKNRANLPDELPFAFASIARIFDSTAPTVPEIKEDIPISPVLEPPKTEPIPAETAAEEYDIPDCVPKELQQLMRPKHVTLEEILYAVAQRGFYPADTPFENYDPDFVNGCLIGAWEQVFALIQENRDAMPF